MSRSYKKNKVIKDSPTSGKRTGNKKFRRKTKSLSKQLIKLEPCKGESCDHSNCDYEDPWMFPESKSEVINDYDVCDFKFFLEYFKKWGIVSNKKLKGKNKKLFK